MKNDPANPVRYPTLARRIEATLIDSVVLSVAFFTSSAFVSSVDLHAARRIIIVALFPFVLDPVLVSVTRASIGHRLRGLRVESIADGESAADTGKLLTALEELAVRSGSSATFRAEQLPLSVAEWTTELESLSGLSAAKTSWLSDERLFRFFQRVARGGTNSSLASGAGKGFW